MTFPTELESMVTENMGLVFNEAYKMAHKYNTPTIDVDDLIQWGSMGLMRAAEKYDPSTGNEFSTYATYYIRGHMMREANRNYGAMSGGVHVMMLSRTIKARGQEKDDPKELSKVYNYSEGLIKNAQRFARIKTYSIDKEVMNNSNEETGKDFHNFHKKIVDFDIDMITDEFLLSLKPKYQAIIREVLDGKTLTDIAKEWGCGRANIFNMRVVIRKRWEQYENGDIVSDTRTGRPRKQVSL